MAELFTNNASAKLAASITAGATSLSVETGKGALFPNPAAPDFFRLVLLKKSTGQLEIVICTARGGDIFTITRAQEGTTALAFDANDIVQLRPTAGFFNSLSVTSLAIQNNDFKYSLDTGVTDGYELTLSPAILSYGAGLELFFMPGSTNTGPCTIDANGVGPGNIKLENGADPYAGAIQSAKLCHVIHNGLNFVLQNPYTTAYEELNLLAGKTLSSANSVLDNFEGLADGNGNPTYMLFQQSAAPTGWTKQTTHNDKALRVVSGAAGSGGSSPFSTVFGKASTDSHALTTAQMPPHNHPVSDPGHDHTLPRYSSGTAVSTKVVTSANVANGTLTTSSSGTGISVNNTGGGDGHSHNMDIRVRYVDLIIARKD